MPQKNKIFLLVFCLIFLPLHKSWAAEDLKAFRVLLHVHSQASGDEVPLEELALLSQKTGVDALVMTEYFQQKLSYAIIPAFKNFKISQQKPSLATFGISRYQEEVAHINSKYPSPLFLFGAEVVPYYWWSGNLFDRNLTVHDLQRNLLVFGLDKDALKEIPTIENKPKEFSSFGGEQNAQPYQKFLDYVANQQGLSIWSTPDEAFGSEFRAGPIRFSTKPYSELLKQTDRFDGVGIYPEGALYTGAPGGIWDALLLKYCQGHRSKPVWAFAEGVIHKRSLKTNWGKWDNIVFAPTLTSEAIVSAFKKGSFYIRKVGSGDIRLLDFRVIDPQTGQKGSMGETLVVHGIPKISLATEISEDLPLDVLSVQVIRDGEVVYEEAPTSRKSEFTWSDPEAFSNGDKTYYRVQSATSSFKSNPIFVVKSNHLEKLTE